MGGVIKYFRFTMDFALWEISHANLIMLMAAIPKYKRDKDKKKNVEGLDELDDILKNID